MGDTIESSTFTKNLDVTFDNELGMNLHVNNNTHRCFYQLRQLRSIRRSLTTDSTKHSLSYRVVLITSTVFFTVPKSKNVVRRLQSILNVAARVSLISNIRKFDHIIPVLMDQLHWFPIRQCIDFKIYSLCLQRPPWSRSDIPQLHLSSCRNRRPQAGNRCPQGVIHILRA